MALKILVIDDDIVTRGLICKVLRSKGYVVHEASNGNIGLQIAKDIEPDILLTDILMPDKEGIETIMDVKKHNPQIKVIAMSGGGVTKNLGFLEMAQKVGANKTLVKPFRPNDLMDAINGLMA